MRVLMIIHTRGHGGAENVFRWLSWRLIREGIDVVAAVPALEDPRQENWIEPALRELDVPVETFDKSGGILDLFRNMRTLIARTKPDIVHSHLLDSNFYSSLGCRALSVPHVCTEHGDVAIKNSLSDKVKYVLLSILSDAIVCVSDAVRSQSVRLALFNRKIEVIHNGIAFTQAQTSTVREEFGIPSGALLIGNVGNLYPVKGQQYLIEAFAALLETIPDAYLLIVGRGREKENLRNQADRLGLARERVVFTGFRSDVGAVFEAIDIYVQASLSEGLPIALLEALSAGVPVVATDVGGVAEVLGGGKFGILVAPGSSAALHAALEKVARDMDTYRTLAKAARDMARERFSLDAMAMKYVALYRRLLEARGMAPAPKGVA